MIKKTLDSLLIIITITISFYYHLSYSNQSFVYQPLFFYLVKFIVTWDNKTRNHWLFEKKKKRIYVKSY